VLISGYARISTDSEEQISSLDNQKSYFTRQIEANGHELYNIYFDEGLTGTALNNRAGFNRMLYDAGLDIIEFSSKDKRKKKKHVVFEVSDREPLFQEIWIKNTSRFARNTLSFDIIQKLRQKEVYIYFVEQAINTRNLGQDLLLKLFQVFDEQDSKDKSLKVNTGMNEVAKRGIIYSTGTLYGYNYIKGERKEDNRLEIIPEEAAVIHSIFNMYAAGMGFRTISNNLYQKGIRNRSGKVWDANSIRRMLNQEKYAGLYNQNKRSAGVVFNKESYYKVKEKYEVKPTDKIPAIVTPELFYKCQELMKSKVNSVIQRGVYHGNSEYAGLIFGSCGHRYHLCKDHSKDFYICSHKRQFGVSQCNSPNISKEAIDDQIDRLVGGKMLELIQGVRDGALTDKELTRYYWIGKLNADNSTIIEAKKEELSQLNKRYDGLLELFTSDLKDKDRITKAMGKIEAQSEILKQELFNLTRSNAEIIEQIQELEVAIDGLRKLHIKAEYSKEEVIFNLRRIVVGEGKSLYIQLELEAEQPGKVFQNPLPPVPEEILLGGKFRSEEERIELESIYAICLNMM
jgi:site-specific DNA recombinase